MLRDSRHGLRGYRRAVQQVYRSLAALRIVSGADNPSRGCKPTFLSSGGPHVVTDAFVARAGSGLGRCGDPLWGVEDARGGGGGEWQQRRRDRVQRQHQRRRRRLQAMCRRERGGNQGRLPDATGAAHGPAGVDRRPAGALDPRPPSPLPPPSRDVAVGAGAAAAAGPSPVCSWGASNSSGGSKGCTRSWVSLRRRPPRTVPKERSWALLTHLALPRSLGWSEMGRGYSGVLQGGSGEPAVVGMLGCEPDRSPANVSSGTEDGRGGAGGAGPPRLIAPVSGSISLTRRPEFRWRPETARPPARDLFRSCLRPCDRDTVG